MLEYYKRFELPVPDLVVLVDISPEESLRRKHTIKNDRYEENLEFLRKVREKYLQLCRQKVFAKEWVVVDGERPLSKVARDIERIVVSRLRRPAHP
jgi:thymidylate kinase